MIPFGRLEVATCNTDNQTRVAYKKLKANGKEFEYVDIVIFLSIKHTYYIFKMYEKRKNLFLNKNKKLL